MNTKPPEVLVRLMSGFAVGAMLGDAFIHQLPHAYASKPAHGGHSHSHSHGANSLMDAIKEQATGLSVMAGILVFFLLEKIILHYGEL